MDTGEAGVVRARWKKKTITSWVRGANLPDAPGPDYDFGTSRSPARHRRREADPAGRSEIGICGASTRTTRARSCGRSNSGPGARWAESNGDLPPIAKMSMSPSPIAWRGRERKPGITAVDFATGQTVWSTPAPTVTWHGSTRMHSWTGRGHFCDPRSSFLGRIERALPRVCDRRRRDPVGLRYGPPTLTPSTR